MVLASRMTTCDLLQQKGTIASNNTTIDKMQKQQKDWPYPSNHSFIQTEGRSVCQSSLSLVNHPLHIGNESSIPPLTWRFRLPSRAEEPSA